MCSGLFFLNFFLSFFFFNVVIFFYSSLEGISIFFLTTNNEVEN